MRSGLFIRKAILTLIYLAIPVLVVVLWHNNYLQRQTDGFTNIQTEIGRLTGLLGVVCLLLQLMLAGRVSWIERLFGMDRLLFIHHLNGFLTILFLAAHPVFLAWGFSLNGETTFVEQYKELLKWEGVKQAAAGLGILIIITLLSVVLIKKLLKYEAWYYIHLLAYLALGLTFIHQIKTGSDLINDPAMLNLWYGLYGFALGNIIFFRFMKPLIAFFIHRFNVKKIVKESDDAVSVYIGGINMQNFDFLPGQFVKVRFLTKGYQWESHPFSISEAFSGKHLRLTIKNSGDFTAKAGGIPEGTSVIIDGPHGTMTSDAAGKSEILLIAGGIGITPLRSLAEEFLKTGKKVTLLYSTRTKNGIVFKDELEQMKAEKNLNLHYIITDNSKMEAEHGKLDGDKLKKLVPDCKDRDVFLCGPPPMMKSTVKILRKLGAKKSSIHWERFAL
ncbi:MAG: ferredoxin reductase family protein [Firmicutes bacterium]|nr:ferredoxin reductase family protein [Bacillota bacterium]